jgi:hypothetical protein
MKNLIYLVLISAFLISCKKEEIVNDIPSIELIETSPTQVVELMEPIYFKISYHDGNGDLGENDPDVHNLILRDPRIDIKYEYRISELVPGAAEVPISGVLVFSIPNAFITDGSTQQTVNFEIYVKDRAGNKSNVINSGTITISQ